MGVKCRGNMVALIFMQNMAVSKRSSPWLSRTNGPELGRKPGFTAKFLCFRAQVRDGVNASSLCIPI
jgi:hypothetical protein